ncbi:PAS domain-containing protein [Fibrella sp. HMF5036]|uniref:histidine kinase n=1 Tax=Fibrella aquatilis TaxID=2817059 RepID=A0A939JY46_9BACT|nr:PAS domain-containing protein [Fibrella aquatilis]
MQDITALLPCGILVLDARSRILTANAFVYDLMGYTADELPGKGIDVLLSVASRIYFQTHIFPLVTLHGSASALYATIQTQQRQPVPVLLNAVRREHEGQQVIYISFIPVHQRRLYEKEILDAKKAAEDALLRNDELLTLQQQLEQHQTEQDRQLSQLQQRNNELEQFSKVITHDLQEPLRKINVFAGLLANEQPGALTSMGYSALAGISKASNRLRMLVSDLQLYFTLTSQRSDIESVDLQIIMQELIAQYTTTGVTFNLTSLPVVMGNRESLTSLFRHLLDNAVKFRKMDDNLTVVRISGTVVGHNSFRTNPDKYRYVDYARITISDNGIGFDNHQREEIFRILKKLHPHTPGMGLGLAVSKKIAEWHNGQISAESAVGKGTKITVLLPIA